MSETKSAIYIRIYKWGRFIRDIWIRITWCLFGKSPITGEHVVSAPRPGDRPREGVASPLPSHHNRLYLYLTFLT